MNRTDKDMLAEALKSLEGIERAKAPDHLLEGIMRKAQAPQAKLISISKKQLSWVAAAVFLLVGLNVLLVSKHLQNQKISSRQNISTEYGFGSDELIKL
ncbi:MAG: hypothetical protein CFE21_08645 [Bacteroidetes bacterium B1(2017)]|nr:MAG: hypothetical protein CFE21_08645 [Bacteroidetes bacterium B1(2017)]